MDNLPTLTAWMEEYLASQGFAASKVDVVSGRRSNIKIWKDKWLPVYGVIQKSHFAFLY
jgi:hypothetical protein